ncbi:hypothetical protein BLOT_011794 [Blomia tropicalis]|nr:hypothetical protein BLOT_011794 [Blomia tropicalis]
MEQEAITELRKRFELQMESTKQQVNSMVENTFKFIGDEFEKVMLMSIKTNNVAQASTQTQQPSEQHLKQIINKNFQKRKKNLHENNLNSALKVFKSSSSQEEILKLIGKPMMKTNYMVKRIPHGNGYRHILLNTTPVKQIGYIENNSTNSNETNDNVPQIEQQKVLTDSLMETENSLTSSQEQPSIDTVGKTSTVAINDNNNNNKNESNEQNMTVKSEDELIVENFLGNIAIQTENQLNHSATCEQEHDDNCEKNVLHISNSQDSIKQILNDEYDLELDQDNATGQSNGGIVTVALYCPIDENCGLFKDKKEILEHQKLVHQVMKYRCRICLPILSFDDKLILHKHLTDEHNSNEEFTCSVCEIKLASYQSLYSHLYHQHDCGIFQCSICRFESLTRNDIFQHLRSVHNRFGCSYIGCEQTFSGKGPLRRHTRIHEKVRPYFCIFNTNSCNYSSTQRGAVMQHIRTVHFGLPRSEKIQKKLNIVDTRDPNLYLHINRDLL